MSFIIFFISLGYIFFKIAQEEIQMIKVQRRADAIQRGRVANGHPAGGYNMSMIEQYTENGKWDGKTWGYKNKNTGEWYSAKIVAARNNSDPVESYRAALQCHVKKSEFDKKFNPY